MRPHKTDWLALISGLLFIAIGIVYLRGNAPEAIVMAPVLLIGLGVAGLIAIIARAIRGQ